MDSRKIRIMFVCLGNICRSPLAECVFKRRAAEAGLGDEFHVVSSGTGHWHVGEKADARMRGKATEHDLSLEDHRARQFGEGDLVDFDYVFVMDKNNLHDVLYFDDDDAFANKVRLFREFDPEPNDFQVPDPYHGGERGFETVFQIVDRTVEKLLERLIEKHDLTPVQ